MVYEELEDRLLPVVEPVVQGMGFRIVSLKSWTKRETLHVHLTLHGTEGVSLQDCATIYRTLVPRIEVFAGTTDLHVEVSSPGINRILKNGREFEIFEGKPVMFLHKENEDWVKGTIDASDAGGTTIVMQEGKRKFTYEEIIKAKLF
ncbi:MAG: hypothetical protein E4H36_07925 [Spirochaetales bacterium]|nr:MAG: hypothetical protein E4H36_07925 [Spirochaetales bacterium]